MRDHGDTVPCHGRVHLHRRDAHRERIRECDQGVFRIKPTAAAMSGEIERLGGNAFAQGRQRPDTDQQRRRHEAEPLAAPGTRSFGFRIHIECLSSWTAYLRCCAPAMPKACPSSRERLVPPLLIRPDLSCHLCLLSAFRIRSQATSCPQWS